MNMQRNATTPLSDIAELARAFDESCRVFAAEARGVTYLRDHDSLQVPSYRGCSDNVVVLHVDGTTARMGNVDANGKFAWIIEDVKGEITTKGGHDVSSARRFLLNNFRL